jgi:hypothetical protein
MIQEMSLELQKEVEDFVQFLFEKRVQTPKRKKGFKFDWEGALEDMREEYTSVELQHKANDWRGA